MKKILALTFSTLLINIGSAQSINCSQSVANGTTYNSCNFSGIQGNNSTVAQGTGNVLGFTGTRGDSVQPQSLASMEADDAARAARVAAMRAQMAQAPSQGLTPYQAQLVAKIRATAVPTAPVDPHPQGASNSGTTDLSKYNDPKYHYDAERDGMMTEEKKALLMERNLAEDAAMRQRVAAMRAQMAQPQAATNNTAQGASNSGTGNVLGFAGVGAPATPVPLSNYKTVAGTQIEQSVADRQANFASGGSLYQQAVAEEKAMRDNVAKIRAQMAQ